ncbi:hypothetical protein ACFIQF_18000 [Comamonas sp. J-3]|jgi:hypothetical protein|uniref:hypothetical protein n=1 Tax=Comamonas trifloxystrobinivorans TaxID=3350256 RepID=UPI00372A4D7E
MTTTLSPVQPSRWWHYWLGFAVVLAVGVWLIAGSQALLFVDTNDFQRVVGHLQLRSLGDGLRWALPEGPTRNPGNPELASHIFTLLAWVQRFLPGHVFDLARSALVAKCLLLAYAWILGWQCARALQRGAIWCTAIALAWLAVFFMAHTIGMAQSFYAEYAFLLGFPLLLIGVLAERPKVRLWCLGLAALVCGLAKVQYFYVPLLLAVCIWAASHWQRLAPEKALIKLLLAVQVLCLVPVLIGKNAALNAYHGLYLGSYMVLTPEQFDGLGVSAEQRRCTGVDAWGAVLSGPGGTDVRDGDVSCFPVEPKLGKSDVLRPYLHYPQALLQLAQYALPHHFTVHYFHVFANNAYLKKLDDRALPATDWLLGMTNLRERTITPTAPVFLVAALLLFALSRRSASSGLRRLAVGGLLLSLLVVSQVLIALLGEGVRDLSKHLWAAQLALDMLVLLCVLQALAWLSQAWSSRTGRADFGAGGLAAKVR